MNTKQVQKFLLSYLEATNCQIIEKTPNQVTVKLSPAADRALTNRLYYWGFVDRAGIEPETMTYTWTFGIPPADERKVPTQLSYLLTPGGRILQEHIYYGSRRLEHLFNMVRQGGRCVTLFEEPPKGQTGPLSSYPYTAWLGVNFKVGYECDVKREELYGWGISLATGVIDEHFLEKMKSLKLTPRLPSNIHLLKNGLSLRKGMTQLEHTLERRLKNTDFSWAVEAEERRQDELERIRLYYEPMVEACEDAEQRAALTARFEQRAAEIDWQYRPRVTLTVLNCGLFHLPGID